MSCETTKNMNIEDEYFIPQGIFKRQNFYVIRGCSGGGKSTLLSELEHRGYKVVPEPGRQIVKAQEAIGGKALPWADLNAFLELALSRYLQGS